MNDPRDQIESLMRWLSPMLSEDETERLRSRLHQLAAHDKAQVRPATRDPFSLVEVIGSSTGMPPG
ncbi:hypothetical protein E4K72_17625 [Oxalobacteraceae bacterium OM1]|nr:hypothetical protein E4K72_17625 [Oxalobacteraceae bacterium OM1]